MLKYGGARYHSLVSDTVAQIDVPTLRAHDVIVARHVNDKMPHKAVSRLAQVNAHLGNFAPQSQKDNGEVYAAALSSPIIP